MNRHYVRNFAILLAIAAVLIGPATAMAIPKTGQALPPFEVTTPAGQKVTNQNYDGKVLLLSFSTDYCSACKKAVPGLVTLAGKYGKQGFHVFGMLSGFGLDDDDLKEYIRTYRVTYPMALFEQSTASEKFGMISVPYFILVGKKGVVGGIYRGSSDATMTMIEDRLKQLLAE